MNLLNSIADVLLPRYCKVCGHRLSVGEQHLCACCSLRLPVMEYHRGRVNPAENRLMGVTALKRAASFIAYEKESDYRRIMYHLKYYGHPDVGSYLASQAARKLMAEGFFDGVDFIVPVPLSRRKKRSRGYNQCDSIAAGIAGITHLPVRNNVVKRIVSNQVQAKKDRLQRWRNASDIFAVTDAASLAGKHVLVVDDILTTGATLSSLIDTMRISAPDIRVSVFTLGLTD